MRDSEARSGSRRSARSRHSGAWSPVGLGERLGLRGSQKPVGQKNRRRIPQQNRLLESQIRSVARTQSQKEEWDFFVPAWLNSITGSAIMSICHGPIQRHPGAFMSRLPRGKATVALTTSTLYSAPRASRVDNQVAEGLILLTRIEAYGLLFRARCRLIGSMSGKYCSYCSEGLKQSEIMSNRYQ